MMNFTLSVASLGQAENDTLEYALLVRQRGDQANQYTYVYSGHCDDLHNFVLDFLENRKWSTEVNAQCQWVDNDTPFDEDLIKVEADAGPAHGTINEMKMEIMIDETVGRDRSANCRADNGSKQQQERVPITIHDRVKKMRQEQNNMESNILTSTCVSTELPASGTPNKPYSQESACKTVVLEKSVVRCIKTQNKYVRIDVDGIGRVHVCKECGACYGRLSLLKKHMKTKHFVSEHRCDICDKYFYDAQSLIRHTSAIHSVEKPFQCLTWDKRFSQKTILKAHIGSIHERHKFVCEKCCKIFNSIGNLMNHALIHSGEKPYICKICGKRFTQSSNLTNHVLIHSGEKSYVCEFCGKGFAQSNGLIQHHRRHLDIKPHPCPDCDMRFVTRPELKSHVNNAHPTRW